MSFCYNSLHLFKSQYSYTFEPTTADASLQRESLVIRRNDGNVSLNGILSLTSPTVSNSGPGRTRNHLIIITGKTKIGNYQEHEIFKIQGVELLPINRNYNITESQKQDDAKYLEMVHKLMELDYYFSYTKDITRSVQSGLYVNKSAPLWQQADDRFYWNRYLQTQLIELTEHEPDQNLSRFILPVICGFCHISELNFTYILISRRNKYRSGARYHCRGIDEQANVANFVETEQILVTRDAIRSYVQTRGSIPLFWRQEVGLKYKPKLVLDNRSETENLFRQHFNKLFQQYGPQIAINLINKDGYEKPLGDEFERQAFLMNDERLKYIHFDFHHECRKMQWHNISKLIQSIEQDLITQSYCKIVGDKVSRQLSTTRTNCIDCLDRTNVVQSILAKRMLEIQLREEGVLSDIDGLETLEFYKKFQNVWSDNADAISTQYSGTGVVQDVGISITRYVKNHYLDGFRQDGFDLILGIYSIEQTSPFIKKPQDTLYTVFFGLLVTLITIIFTLQSQTFYQFLIRFVLAVGAIYMCSRLLNDHQHDLVSLPQLIKPKVKREYSAVDQWQNTLKQL
ncbi:Phosphatidylinositide phosphatase SAC1 [Boothiomyces macroporosus]|uniref:Phosphatidylinositide phosphatase SAC1 n=1 Tax=Boothiomyces macroporosus TaxID=261099 RepID=A0AAD5UCR6_9FUNG|nr:Phosphatidylinositide phosphatase SAC1 [Boothiomyces macroporosus]